MGKIREPTATCDSHNEDVFQSRYLFLFRTCLNPIVLEHASTKIKICSRPAKDSLTCGQTQNNRSRVQSVRPSRFRCAMAGARLRTRSNENRSAGIWRPLKA